MDVFLKQDEAWSFARQIRDPKERLLTEIALANAFSFMAGDPAYRQSFREQPFDMLQYARTVHDMFTRSATIRGVLDGTITSVADLDPFA